MGNDVSKINVNPSNYIQGNNQMNNYSNSRNGNLMQVNNSVSTADTSRLRTSSSQVEEMDLNIEESITNTSNISMPENNSMAQIEKLEQTIAKSLENLEQQEKYLRESYNKFANAPQNSYPGLYFDGNKYLNPSEYAAVYYSRYNSYTYGVSTNHLNTIGYAAINGTKQNASSTIYMMSIEEYEKLFNEYFEKTVGYDYNQYQNNLNLINQELTKLKASKYSIAQMKKQQPYLEMTNTKEYLDYVNENKNNTSFSALSLSQKEVGLHNGKHIETLLIINGVEVNPAEANLIKIAMELEKKGSTDTAEYNYIKNYMYTLRYQFLTENDKLMYSYLYDTKGKKAADAYIEAIKDDLNRREGQASAEKFIKSITDKNGNIKLSAHLKTSVKGFLDGNDNFYDGLANITATEGMISVNQYEQMYILQYLTNSKGIYIEKILETKSPEEAQRISEGIYTADGKINHQFAKENLTEEEYLKLLEKIQQDEFGILDENYQISTSIGNMAPSMLVSATANILLPGSSFALMGSTLMGLSSGGNSLNQSLIDGNDLHAARMYGLCSGLSETTVGYLLGNIPYLSKVSEFSVKGILKEGLEEGIQEFVDAGMRATILGEHIELNQLGQDALKSFIYGCVTSFIMNGGQATVEFSINGVMHRYENINDFIDGMKPYLPDDVQSQFDNTQINDTVKRTDTSINASIDDNAIAMANYYTNKGITQTFSFSEAANLPDINHSFWTSFDNPENIQINIDGRIMTFDDAISYKKNYDLNMKNNNALSTQQTTPSINNNSYDSSIENINSEINNLKYSKMNIPNYVANYIASNIRKYAYKNTNSFNGLNEQIIQNGLYHFTNSADAIIDSGYIKASGINASYGTPKSFFFNGVPDVGAFATNLDSIPIKTTAVKVIPTEEIVNSSKLKLRHTDDMAITYEGKFDLNGMQVEKCYFGLVAENGELVYKQISEELYNNYENTNMAKVLSEYTSNKQNITAIKGNFLKDIAIRNKNAVLVLNESETFNIENSNAYIKNLKQEVDLDSEYKLKNGIEQKYKDAGALYQDYLKGKVKMNLKEYANAMNHFEVRDKVSLTNKIGQKLESIFFDEEYVIGVHRTGIANPQTILENGLFLTGHQSSGSISGEIDLNNNITFHDDFTDFIKAISQSAGYKTDGIGEGNAIIVKIPKSDINNFNKILQFTGTTPILKAEYLIGSVKTSVNSDGKIVLSDLDLSNNNQENNRSYQTNSSINDPTAEEQNINLTDIVESEVADFIIELDDFKEVVKDFNKVTDEELPFFEVFRTKLIECGSVDNILNNIDTFTEWEIGMLVKTNSPIPILVKLFKNQTIIDYIRKNMTKKEILNDYGTLFPNHSLITSTFLSLTNEEINDLSSWTVFDIFKSSSLDVQKQFIESHTDFFEKEKDSIFYKSLSKEAFLAIFDKVGSYEFLKSKMWNISSLSSEIQIELYNKYKSTIYNGTQKDFIEFARHLNDGDYQTDFIKSSPFYSEIINSTKFETLFSNIKSKEFALELFKDSDARIKIENSSDAFKKLVSLLTIEEQYNLKEIAKEKILDINNTSASLLMISGANQVYSYIGGFNEVIQNELLNDFDIINSMPIKTMIRLNEKFKGVYLEQMKNMLNGNFNAESAELLFEPAIFQLMDQDTINRAALALKGHKYDKLAKLGNTESINVVIDKIVANNFSDYYSGGLISLYEATNEIGKQKIADNISFSALINTINSYKGEQFTDILANRLSSPDALTEMKITDLRKISQFKPESYEKIFPYLNSKLVLLTFNYDIVTKLGLTEEFINIFRENPSLINYMDTYNKGPLNFLKLLSRNDDMEIFYNNITLKTLFDIGNSPEFNIMNLEKVKNILKDGLSSYNFMYLNEFSGLARILDNYSVPEQLEILNTMEVENKYFLLLHGNIKNKETKFEMIKLMMNDPTFRTSISADNIENFKGFFDNLEVEYIDYILKNADNHFLGFMLTITKRNDLNLKFNEMINENSLILNEFEYSDAELIYGNLSNRNKILLDNKINSMISNIGNEKISILFSDATTAQKSSFLDAYNKGLITKEKIDLLIKIKSKNKFVLSTFNYSLFDETIYQFGEVLLTKLSKYYDVVDQIVELKNSPHKFKLFAQFIINDNTPSSVIVSDQKMAMLLNYLLENDIDPVLLSVSNLTELEAARNIILKQIDQFSILDGVQEIDRDRRIIVPDNYTLDNYDLKLTEKCDSLLKDASTVEEVKNLIFNKYFSISIEDATELFRTYGSKFFEIKNLDTKGIATTYLENMLNILNATTMKETIDIYNEFNSENRYSMDETLNIIHNIKQIYTKSLKNTLFNPTEVTGYVEYDGKKIPIYEPQGDFQMLIQSTYTNYGGMPMINNNYFDSWNLSSRTANHGICCSLISNNNMGMAAVRGPGVVIGFNSFSDEQMNMMAPYDIYTKNDGYVIKCQRPLLYLPGQDVMNETRHTHNEFNLERTNLTGEGELANIQPDYVVVFEEMSEEQKLNAYKASVDFNVPLVYINKTALAASESAKIDNLISEYNSTGNIKLLKEILVLHENNRSGYRNQTDSSLITQYFSSERISNVLNNAILQSNAEELIYIKEFLEDELRKFDTTLEATHRANEIDIDAKGLIDKIEFRQNNLIEN